MYGAAGGILFGLVSYAFSGGKRDFAEAYRLYRGRDPEVGPLLENRGLVAA
mgnify:CR=1 FL=1